MSSIKCTGILAKKAGFKLAPPETNTPDDWHANTFSFDRRTYVIFVHDLSRLTCLAGPVRKPDLQDLADLLKRSLRTILIHEGYDQSEMAFALSKLDGLGICKTDNRSVLGTINDNLIRITNDAAEIGGMEVAGFHILAAHVNYMPMAPLKWKFAIEEYHDYIAQSAT